LLERGEDDKAFDLIDRAFSSATGEGYDPLLAEMWFYLLLLGPVERREEALAELAPLVASGVRSPGWDFSKLLARSRLEERSDVEWLERMADVISARVEVEVLRDWVSWPDG
jgi:hypothetical protein